MGAMAILLSVMIVNLFVGNVEEETRQTKSQRGASSGGLSALQVACPTPGPAVMVGSLAIIL